MAKVKLKVVPINPNPNPTPSTEEKSKKKLVVAQGFLALREIEPNDARLREAVKLILT